MTRLKREIVTTNIMKVLCQNWDVRGVTIIQRFGMDVIRLTRCEFVLSNIDKASNIT